MSAAAGRLPDPGFWRGRRVLVTGHTGFKGAWLSEWLLALGAEIHGLALAPPTAPALFDQLGLGARLADRRADIRDAAATTAAVGAADPEVILHLAAQPLVRAGYADPVGTFAANVMGAAHVLEAARACEALRAIVVVSSDKCYANREWLWPYREDEALGGRDPYSASKAATEMVAAAWGRSFLDGVRHPARTATARAGNVIGGGDYAADRLVPDCLAAFAAGRPVRIRSPAATRPWQHVLEPLAGYLVLAEALAAGGVAEPEGLGVGAWNFGPAADDAWPVGAVCDALVRLWGDGAGWERDGDPGPHEAGRLAVDAAKARALLGWRPRLRVADALAWTVAWTKSLAAGGDAAALCRDQIRAFAEREPAC